MTCSRPDEMWL